MHTFWHSSKAFLKGYQDFYGRTSRAEYWWAVVFNGVLHIWLGAMYVLLSALVSPAATVLVTTMYVTLNLYLQFCTMALIIRRLHDINRSGWWFLILFTGIGLFVLLYWYCVEGDKKKNRFGPNPYARD